jgi:hypothetical protein
MVRAVVLGCLLLAGCGADGAETAAGAGAGPADCAAGERPDASGCIAAGVPPGACPPGFVPAELGCSPVLPPAACGPGTMALPGETSCRPVSACGRGTFGDIAPEPGMQYVDESFQGTSDGTIVAPWPTIQEAVLALAGRGGAIAVAAGSYDGEIVIGDAIHLVGRCPELVEVRSVAADRPAIFVSIGGDGTVIASLATTGLGYGVAVNAGDVRVEHAWVHDTGRVGVVAIDGAGPASVTVSGSLVENARQAGVFAAGGVISMDTSAVRGTRGIAGSAIGTSVGIVVSPMSGLPGSGTIRQSLLTDAVGAGVALTGGDLVVEDTAIADTAPLPTTGEDGHGILGSATAQVPASVAVRGTFVTGSHEAGIVAVGCTVAIEETTVTATHIEQTAGTGGAGIALQQGGALPAHVGSSYVADSEGAGLLVVDSHVVVESLAVERSGVVLYTDDVAVVAQTADAALEVFWSRIAHGARAGISSFGAFVAIAGDLLECNTIHLDGETYLERAFQLEDRGGNACGCDGVGTPCKVLTANLEPPGEL